MVSNLSLPIDVEKNMLGIVTEHRKNSPIVGEELRLYIPILMTNIVNSAPTSHIVKLGSSQLFLNDIKCRPNFKNVIKSQNYITAKMENDTTWIHKNLTDEEFNVNPGDKVECHTPNGKLSKLLFNNSKYI